MFAVVIRALLSFLIPGGLIFAAAALVVTTGMFADSLPVLVGFYRYAVLVAGLMLGWRFGRSRLAFAVLVLAVSDTALQQFATGSVGIEGVGGVVRNSIAFLLPLNLVFFSYIKERGFLSLRGAMRFGLILIEIAGIFLLCRHLESRIVTFLDYQPIKSDLLMSAPLSLPALLAFIAASLLISVRYIQQRNPLEGGFIWALVMVFYALTQVEIGTGSTFYLSTAGFILVASVIESSHGMAFRDELTGLPGRRALNEYFLKLGTRYTIGMLDIDFFKKVNDKYGHDVGDQVLRMVASRISKISGGGRAFRYGGEEFTLVFPGKQVDETVPYLERLRKAIEQEKFVLRARGRPRKRPEDLKAIKTPKHGIRITVSIGVAEKSAKNPRARQVIVAADKALYGAKQKGRNRIVTE